MNTQYLKSQLFNFTFILLFFTSCLQANRTNIDSSSPNSALNPLNPIGSLTILTLISTENSPNVPTNCGEVVTIAGSYPTATSGYQDGTGTLARLTTPWGNFTDSAGNIFIAEELNHIIRKITSTNVVSTFAGAYPVASAGFIDATGTAARFNHTSFITQDIIGNFYVSDYSNHAIRKISQTGVVTTFAGAYPTATSGYFNGTGTAARFNNPTGIIIDNAGNLFISDNNNHAIRKITSAGVVTTIAGAYPTATSGFVDGTGTTARFNSPLGITIDTSGNLYVVDSGNNAIRKITSSGVVTTIAGAYPTATSGFLDGTGSASRFNSPNGIAIDSSGSIYVSEIGNSAIRKITLAGVVTTIAGSYPTAVAGFLDGIGNTAKFNWPTGLSITPSGDLIISDGFNSAIRKLSCPGNL